MRRKFSWELYFCHWKIDPMLANFLLSAAAISFSDSDSTGSESSFFLWISFRTSVDGWKANPLCWESLGFPANGSPREQVLKAHKRQHRLASQMSDCSSIRQFFVNSGISSTGFAIMTCNFSVEPLEDCSGVGPNKRSLERFFWR